MKTKFLALIGILALAFTAVAFIPLDIEPEKEIKDLNIEVDFDDYFFGVTETPIIKIESTSGAITMIKNLEEKTLNETLTVYAIKDGLTFVKDVVDKERNLKATIYRLNNGDILSVQNSFLTCGQCEQCQPDGTQWCKTRMEFGCKQLISECRYVPDY